MLAMSGSEPDFTTSSRSQSSSSTSFKKTIYYKKKIIRSRIRGSLALVLRYELVCVGFYSIPSTNYKCDLPSYVRKFLQLCALVLSLGILKSVESQPLQVNLRYLTQSHCLGAQLDSAGEGYARGASR